jgi:hypothetical protein
MSTKRYFQLSYVWPIVLPVAVLFLPRGFVEDWIQQLCSAVLYSGGVPYALFAGAILLWSVDKEGASVRRSTSLAPVLFLPALGMSVVIAAHRETYRPSPGQLALAVVFYGMVLAIPVLILGYCYVGLINLGFVILRSLGAFSLEQMALATPRVAEGYAEKASFNAWVRPESREGWSCGPVTQAGNPRRVAYSGGATPSGATPLSGGVPYGSGSYVSGMLHPDGSPYGFAGWEDEKMKGASRSCQEIASESRAEIETAATINSAGTASSCAPARPAGAVSSQVPGRPAGTANLQARPGANMVIQTEANAKVADRRQGLNPPVPGGHSSAVRGSAGGRARAAVNPAYSGWPSPTNDWKAQKKQRSEKPLVAWDPLKVAAFGLMAPLVLLSAFAMWRHAVNPNGHPVLVHQVDRVRNGVGTGHK